MGGVVCWIGGDRYWFPCRREDAAIGRDQAGRVAAGLGLPLGEWRWTDEADPRPVG